MDGITYLLTEMQSRGLLDESTVKAGLTDWDWALDDLEREAVEALLSPESMMARYVETMSGLTLLQRYQHHDQCVCPDMNEAPPPHADVCVYRRNELVKLICAIEAEARVDADYPPVPKVGALVTLIEAAAILGVTPDNLRGAIKRGSLKATKVGRDWHVTKAEVERYGREHRRQTGG